MNFLLITWNSFKQALAELRTNKLRTFLSLLGITFGIFSIISVLSTIASMKLAITDELNSIGNHVIFVQKWENSTDSDYPWWKFINRPQAKYAEMTMLERKLPWVRDMAFMISITSTVEHGGDMMSGVNYYGVSEKFNEIQNISIGMGRYFQLSEFHTGVNVVVMGYTIAEQLFGNAENALYKKVNLRGDRSATVIGIIAKEGKSILDAWDYDHSIIIPYYFLKQLTLEEYSDPLIMVKGDDAVPIDNLRNEIKGAMRSIRKLRPGQDDNFGLNDIGFFSKFLEPLFLGLNIGGWAIAALSLFVGMFGVANIMFVTVRERTGQIGLKKAVGAKKINVISEFLLESIFLCIIGGAVGLLAVFVLTQIFSAIMSFRVFIPVDIIALAIGICVFIGILAGIIPALKAANMNPVVAIRSVS
ncbi:MAG TPA: ABC transporter permease [Puia sp.]|nr:ABC transporter permease [Puia sp.]